MAHYSKVNTGINYRSYVAQLKQEGSNPPDPIVLHNDLGYTPTWGRYAAGRYDLSATEFGYENNDKIIIFLNIGTYVSNPMELGYMAHAVWDIDSQLVLLSTAYYNGSSTGYVLADDLLSDAASDDFHRASFELRIYN